MPLTEYAIERIVRLHNNGEKPAAIVRILAENDQLAVTRQSVDYQIKVSSLILRFIKNCLLY